MFPRSTSFNDAIYYYFITMQMLTCEQPKLNEDTLFDMLISFLATLLQCGVRVPLSYAASFLNVCQCFPA